MAHNTFSEWTRRFSDFKASPVDMSQLVTLYRRNAETGSTILQIATESAQIIARRQAEIVRSNAEHALKASKELLSRSSADRHVAKHADLARDWWEYNVNSMRELLEISNKSTQDAFDALNKRFSDQARESSRTTGKTTENAKKKAA